MRVLVVDDNAGSRQIVAEILKSMSFRVELAESGSRAIALVRERPAAEAFRLVVMDWQMPGMDGIEAARRLGELPGRPPAVILMTAFDIGAPERASATAAGASAFLAKPVTASTLADAIIGIFQPELVRGLAEQRRSNGKAWDLSGARILLVEDNEINQQIAEELLRAAGVEVVIARNGREAIEKLTPPAPPFHAVLMDIQMPEMDGYEATRRIRAAPWGAKLPIVAMTAHALEEERRKALETGMDRHVTKPIDPDVLFQTLSQFYGPAERRPPERARREASDPGKKEAPAAAVPAIEGVDVVAGLRRLAGNRRLYESLLRRFVEGQWSLDIAAAVARGDPETAERLAHTLRGTAGTLGVEAVQAAATELEERFRSGSDPAVIEAARRSLDQSLDAAKAAIRSSLQPGGSWGAGEASAVLEPSGGKPDIAGADLDRLARMLEEHDTEAAALFRSLESGVRHLAGTGKAEAIRDAIAAYDFAAALACVRELQGKVTHG